MIADAKINGTSKDGISVAKYMLDPNAKRTDTTAQQLQKSHRSERILKIETDYAFPAIRFLDPKAAAKRFIGDIEKWNVNHRPGKAPPKSGWEHRVISFHPSDSSKVSPALACQIARHSLKEVAPGQRPTLYVVHGDSEHLHVHLMYATVDEKGRIHNPHGDYREWEKVMEKMELQYGLYRVEKRLACSEDNPSRHPDLTNPTKSEFRMTKRTDLPSCKHQLRQKMESILLKCESIPLESRLTAFIKEVQNAGVGISVHTQSTGNVLGFRLHFGIFEKKGIKSSCLGRAYAWQNLSKSIGYNPRDQSQLTYLKSNDHRLKQWIKSPSGGKNWAKKASHTNPAALARSTGLCKSIKHNRRRSVDGGIIPDFYPSWLRRHIRSIVAEANVQLQRALAEQEANTQRSLNIAYKLLISVYNRRSRLALQKTDDNSWYTWEATVKNP